MEVEIVMQVEEYLYHAETVASDRTTSNSPLTFFYSPLFSDTLELPTSSTVLGTTVKFLPTQATVSLVSSQLQTLGHLPACPGRTRENISRQDTAEAKCICRSTREKKALRVKLRHIVVP